MNEITMPSLSDSMEQGTVLRWLKAAGDEVAVGDELVEIETDKATMTYESPVGGTLADPVAEGSTHAVGAVIATVGVAGRAPDGGPRPAAAAADADHAPPADDADHAPPVSVSERGPGPDSNGRVDDGDGDRGERALRATPLARRLAAAHGVRLATVTGSGPRGRIVRSDVAAAAGLPAPSPSDATPAPPEAVATAAQPESAAPRQAGSRELTRTQRLIARRMAEAKATVPHFQVETEAVVDALLDLREQLKQVQRERPPSLNDFIVKAAALALREFPLANASYRDGRFELHERVNVGIAVATDDSLIVPTVPDADSRSLGSIAREARRLAGAVRDGSITAAELSGATFTVSNLGMYGMTAITPVVNPPQAAILGVGAARTVLARAQGEIVERRLMTLTLSCDHRILYGAEAARFLSRIRDLLEQPLALAF